MSKRAKTVVTLDVKFKALQDLERGDNRVVVQDRYGIKRTTLLGWIQDKQKIFEKVRNNRTHQKYDRMSKWPYVDSALYEWFCQSRSSSIPLTGPLLLQKAQHFGKRMYGSQSM